ncbi:MAG: hypothetical protein JWN56_2494 [Sphingobacteriales bacterium]|nr:hypothetical protein [Sphingobacteriales bacterium]
MRNFTKLVALAIGMIGYSATSFAQTDVKTDQASASATIITPITIAKVNDMSFGNIVSTATGGTVILSTASGRTESGVQLGAVAGTVTAASYTVTGQSGYAYTVTLPADGYEITTGAAGPTETMTLTNFNSSSTGNLTAASFTLSVGATLNVVANQAAGDYTNATPFDVSVNYN